MLRIRKHHIKIESSAELEDENKLLYTRWEPLKLLRLSKIHA